MECGAPLAPADRARRRCAGCPAPYDEATFERLREWRRLRAKDDEVAAFMVFSNATLEQIAEQRPGDRSSLLRISGIGPDKLDKYGDDLLAVLVDTAAGKTATSS